MEQHNIIFFPHELITKTRWFVKYKEFDVIQVLFKSASFF